MLRVLIVDDEELSIKRLKRMLLESGAVEHCHTFQNPADAYEFAKENPIDAAFLDIAMPKINGLTLAELLKKLQSTIDIVFVTGFNQYAVKAFDLSASDYLLKPVAPKRLAQTLSKIGKGHRPVVEHNASYAAYLFNGLKIVKRDRPDEPHRLRSPKTEELFAFLICKRTVSRDEIIGTLWNGLEPGRALRNLNTTLYYVRKALSTNEDAEVIKAGRTEILIEENHIHCDLYEFERVLQQIRKSAGSHPSLYKQAETLYAGKLLQGKNYEWADELSRRLERDYIELLESAARSCWNGNQRQDALHYFTEILKWDDMREDIHQEVIRLYMELGRRNEALRQYRLLEEMLLREFGALPDPRLGDLISGDGRSSEQP